MSSHETAGSLRQAMAAAQAKDQALERYCAARTRNGGPCKQPAGHGTPHPGKGPCKLHGGCMPNVVKRYATIEAREASASGA
jgi:hypothetical protein